MVKRLHRTPDPDQTKRPPGEKKKFSFGTNRPKVEEDAESRDVPDTENLQDTDDAPSGENRRTVTNTEEQNKITNSDNSDSINEKEREGD
jgi:hypothetical protein